MADDVKKLAKAARDNPQDAEAIGRWVQARARTGEKEAETKKGKILGEEGMASYYRIKVGTQFVVGYRTRYSYGRGTATRLGLSKTGHVFKTQQEINKFISDVIAFNDLDKLNGAEVIEYRTVVFDTRDLGPEIKNMYAAHLEKQKQAAIDKLEELKKKTAADLQNLEIELKKRRRQ